MSTSPYKPYFGLLDFMNSTMDLSLSSFFEGGSQYSLGPNGPEVIEAGVAKCMLHLAHRGLSHPVTASILL